VARHIFHAWPVWIYTQSNITNNMFTRQAIKFINIILNVYLPCIFIFPYSISILLIPWRQISSKLIVLYEKISQIYIFKNWNLAYRTSGKQRSVRLSAHTHPWHDFWLR
jgi:hypothetical protein